MFGARKRKTQLHLFLRFIHEIRRRQTLDDLKSRFGAECIRRSEMYEGAIAFREI